jgi:hypothetical protein
MTITAPPQLDVKTLNRICDRPDAGTAGLLPRARFNQ